MNTKAMQIDKLWSDLARDKQVTKRIKIRNGKSINIGFINQYAKHSFIPNKWFDWKSRCDAKIMIIGQDWGPYSALLKFINEYESQKSDPLFDYNDFLFKSFSSRTEKFIINSISKSFLEEYNHSITQSEWNDFVFTVAVMFTRQGKHFRGSEFYDEKFGVLHSMPFLKRQIEIIKPKIIIPLGGTAWSMINEIFALNIKGTISKVIKEQNFQPIHAQSTTIIPNFHPASHTDPKLQYKIWKTLWNY